MIPFASAASLTPAQIVAATRAMLSISRVDPGNTEEELALIRGFYEGCQQEAALPPFQSLIDQPDEGVNLDSAVFPDPDQRDLVLASCLMVAYADGALSSAEREAVLELSRQIGASVGQFDNVLRIVQDYLLQQVSGLLDTASAAKVAQELQ